MTSPCDRWVGRAGFTLIELLVVLAIISLLLALVPNVTGGIGGVRFRGAARELTAQLREMQAMALGTGNEITFAIDPRGRFWRSSLDGRMHGFPPEIETIDVRFPGPTAAPPILRFLPDGSASQAVLTLAGSHRRHAEITIDGLIGRVRLDD